MTRKRRRRRDADELREDPALPGSIAAALKHGDRKRAALRAGAWLSRGAGGESGAQAAERVLERASVTVGGIPVAEAAEVRGSLARHAGHERAHLRTWYRTAAGHWRPTARGVTVAPDQLEQLEAIVHAMREAYAAGALGPPPALASGPPGTSDAEAKPDTLPPT